MADPGHIAGAVYIPNCIAVRLHWKLPNGKKAYNVLHARYATPPAFNQTNVNALFTAITTGFTASGIAGRLDTETSLTNVGLRDMRQDVGGFGFGEWVSNNAGVAGSTAGGAPYPAQIAFVVSLKTGRAGQAGRGRVYIPGFNTNAADTDGNPQSGTAQDCVDFVTAVSQALTDSSYTLALGHPARAAYTGAGGANHPARAAEAVPVTGITYLNLVWDTQRLRSHL